MKAYRRNRGIEPLILTLALDGGMWLTSLALDGGTGMWLNSRHGCFTPGKEPHCPLNRGRGGSQSRSGRFGGEKNIVALAGFEPQSSQPVVKSLNRLH
jgi:hypothetical protein